MRFKLTRPGARLPTYGTAGAACFDLYAVMDFPVEVYSGTCVTVNTGLAFEIPEGFVMLVYSRSGHGFNSDVRLSNCVGVIDSDYRGELKVKVRRDGNDWVDPFVVNHGDRIAQGMLMPVQQVQFEQVDELSDTQRGEGGMGSTGK